MEQNNSTAVYDVLLIAEHLEKYNNDFNISEINLFSYFACLLSLYNGERVSNWGYSFIKNKIGVPISAELQSAIHQEIKCGHLISKMEGYYNLSSKGKTFLDKINIMPRYKERSIVIENACSSLLVNPIGNIRTLLNSDPIISSTKESSLRELLDEHAGTTELLYKQFRILKDAFDCELRNDLFIVAVTWLKCIHYHIKGFGYANK